MKMVALPSSKQRSVHGPAMNVPSIVNTIFDMLPRLPSQKLKCKVAYKGHYMYGSIRPQKLLDTKANNPLYADIAISLQWVEEAITNDEEVSHY